MESIHIDKFPLNTSIIVKKEFLTNLIKLLKKEKIHYKELYNKFPNKTKIKFNSFKDNLKISYKNYRRLDILMYICNKVGVSFKRLERKIISYKTKRGTIIIKNPKLPIKTSPIFYMLYGHIMADGHFAKNKGIRSGYVIYTQYNKNLRLSFLDKVNYVFGELKFQKEYFQTSKKICLPEVISLILSKHLNYTERDFLTENARFPDYFFKLNKKSQLAILISFIMDEGNIDSGQIIIRLINKPLLLNLKRICDNLKYPSKITNGKNKMYNLYILKEGLKKFWRDYNILNKNYPFLTMNYKEKEIENYIKRNRKIWVSSGKNVTKNKIISLLEKGPLKVKDISYFLQLSRQGIKYNLNNLLKEKIISRKVLGKGFQYILIKNIKLNEGRKGISRKKDFSKNKILNILKKDSLSAKSISKIIKIDKNTTRNLLYDLENKNKIQRAGKRKVDKHHYELLWKITKR